MAKTASAKSTTKKTTTKKKTTSELPVVETTVQIAVEEPIEEEPVTVTVDAEPDVEPVETAPASVVYANPGDKMMTLIHLCFSRTPVHYGNGKVKVFNKFGDKFSLSVREFEQEFASSSVGSALLEQRLIAVCDDCPADTRERLDLEYGKGEILNPKTVKGLFTMPDEQLCEVFENLCMEHKALVVQYFANDLEPPQMGGTNGFHCSRAKIKKLNDISKKYVKEGERGMFASILEQITRAEEENY